MSISRRDLVSGIISAVGVVTATTLTQPAYADVTNKIASQASLRYIKRSVKEFEKLELYASMDDYTEIKEAIRAPALSEIRKNASVIIRGAEGGPESKNLETSYKAFISSLEKLDSQSSLALRGKKGISLMAYYDGAKKELSAFGEFAEKAVSIPLQTEDDVAVSVAE